MITMTNVAVRYPVFSPFSYSFQRAIYNKVGGLIGGISSERPYIEALKDINLSIQDGSRLGIIGHNGAGKTTLLRVLSGVYPPSTGTVSTRGRISALTDITLGMEPYESGLKNIIFRLVVMGFDFTTAKEAVEEIVAFSDLGEFIRLPVHSYSTGMYLRLAFAIATHFPPDILILDEIVGAGDEGFRAKAQTRIENMLDSARIVILSSHDLGALRKYCTEAVLLDHGTVVARGDVKSTLADYQSRISLAV